MYFAPKGKMETINNFLVNPSLGAKLLIKKIDQNFKITPPTSDKCNRFYFDTFDWRLLKKGLSLFWEKELLVLASLKEKKSISTTFQDQQKIKFSQTLPPGQIHDLVAPVIEMRALQTMAMVKVNNTRLNILNKDTKSTVRLHFEELVLPHQPESLPVTSLTVDPIRGYRKEAKKIYNFLKSQNNTPTDNNSLIKKIFTQTHQTPGSYSTKINIIFSEKESTDMAAVAIFKSQVEVMKQNEEGIKKDIDSEFLHDFRVALRRSRAGLSQLKGIFSDDVTLRYKKELKDIGQMTNRLRDLDVYLLKKEYYSAMLPDSLQPELNHLFTLLNKERQKEKKKVINRLNGVTYKNNMADWQNFLDNYASNSEQSGPSSAIPVQDQSKKYILKAWRKVIRNGRLITEESPDKELHALRLQCKKLRYLMEFFSSLFPQKYMKKLIKQLKNLQENLGDFNDLCVQQETLQDYLLNQVPGSDQHISIAAAIGGLITNLNLQQHQVRKVFNKTYKEFDHDSNNLLFKTLFGKGK